MHFSPLQLLSLLFPMCSHLPASSAELGAKVWAQGCCSGLLSVEQSRVIVYSTCWHVPEWHLPFFQQYHIVDSCSLPASLWPPDWFARQPSPSHQLVLLLGTRVFLPECRPPCPSHWVSPCWFQIHFILFYQARFEFQFCLWKCCSGLSSLTLLKILLKPWYTTSTAYPYPPALWPHQRRKFIWFDIICSSQIHVSCFPSPCYPLRVTDSQIV